MLPATQVSQRSASTPSGITIAILALVGDVSSEARSVVLNAYHGLESNPVHLLLDFTRVSYINSCGIAIVIKLMIEAQQKGGPPIGIFGLTPHFQKIFKLVRVDKYATIYPDETSALAALD